MSPSVTAIMECFFPAQSTGEALFRVLTGLSIPAGRLPATWPAEDNQVSSAIVLQHLSSRCLFCNWDAFDQGHFEKCAFIKQETKIIEDVFNL